MTQERVVDAFCCHGEAKKGNSAEFVTLPRTERAAAGGCRSVESVSAGGGRSSVNLNHLSGRKTKTGPRRGAADIWDTVH